MTKMLVFDMDGTIADFYNFPNWLARLREFSTAPYEGAKPIYKAESLIPLLYELKDAGWRIAVTSWGSMETTPEYSKAVRVAKKEWLDRYGFPYDEIHVVKYGTPKTKCTRGKADFQVLVDDNADVRAAWTLGAVIDANQNILNALVELLTDEIAL